MRKTILKALSATTIALISAGCQHDPIVTDNPTYGRGNISFSTETMEDETRTVLSKDGKTTVWAETDRINVYMNGFADGNHSNYTIVPNSISEIGGATFTGDHSWDGSAGDHTFHAYYLGGEPDCMVNPDGTLDIPSLSMQTQGAELASSRDHIARHGLIIAAPLTVACPANTAEAVDLKLKFYNMYSMLEVRLAGLNDADLKIERLTAISDAAKPLSYRNAVIDLTSSGTPHQWTIDGGQAENRIALDFSAPAAMPKTTDANLATEPADEHRLLAARMLAVPVSHAETGFSFEIKLNSFIGYATVNKTAGPKFEPGKRTVTTIAVNPTGLARLTTNDPEELGANSLKLSATISDPGIISNLTEYGIEYRTADDQEFIQEVASSTDNGKYTITVAGLTEEEACSYRAYVVMDGDTFYGETKTTGTIRQEIDDPVYGYAEYTKMYGYAAAAGTTGGEGATAANTHHFDNGKAFREWLKLREKNKSEVPAIVWLSGTFTKEDGRALTSPWFDIKRTKNISIYGTDDFRMKNVGFFLKEAHNIIIRNVYIQLPKADNGADGISMQDSEKVWVDHCTFESMNSNKDYEDGSCDITHASTDVTVSWNHFIRTQKTMLIGHSNSATADVAIRASVHHNYFDQSNSRHPRVRFGTVHVYNNYYGAVSTYGVGSAYGARVLVEGNYFDGVHLPTDICTFPAKQSGSSWVSNLTGSVAGYLYERGNLFVNKPSNASDPYPFTNVGFSAYNVPLATPLTYANDFKAPYIYEIDPPAAVSERVPELSGVGKLGYISAPLPVDNAGIVVEPGDGGDDGDDDDDNEGVDIGNGWLLANIGDAGASVSVSDEGQLSLTAMGKVESSAQTFGVVYREVEAGDFEISVCLDSFTPSRSHNQGFCGLVMFNEMNVTGTNMVYMIAGTNGEPKVGYARRADAGAGQGKNTYGNFVGGTYVKFKKQSGKWYFYSSADGITYTEHKNESLTAAFQACTYIGVMVCSSETSKYGTGVFSDFRINGEEMPFLD